MTFHYNSENGNARFEIVEQIADNGNVWFIGYLINSVARYPMGYYDTIEEAIGEMQYETGHKLVIA